MNIRTLVIAFLVFFSLAPAAFANGQQANGTSCSLSDGSECQSGVCASPNTLKPSRFCQPCTSTSCGSGKTCQSGYCVANATPSPTPITPQTIVAPQSSTPPASPVTLINPLQGVDCSGGNSNGNCLSAFLTNILKFVVNIGTIIVIFMLVYVGFLFVVAQGNETKIRDARNALLWTVIGALILLGAQAISLGIQATVSALGG
ncbi:MAG TPA: pilin [Candidatus Paceibacterota bacterium]|nr:pilin [Candidatus Paceibacterota bacterium]